MTSCKYRIALCAAFALITPIASAQAPAPGDIDMYGRVLAKVTVTMTEPSVYGHPVTGLLFFVISENGDTLAVRTDDTGSVRVWVLAGTYRFVTPEPISWQRNAYTWDMVAAIRPGTALIRLSPANASTVVALGRPPTSTPAAPSQVTPSPAVQNPPAPNPPAPNPPAPNPAAPNPAAPSPATTNPAPPNQATPSPATPNPAAPSTQVAGAPPTATTGARAGGTGSPSSAAPQGPLRHGVWLNVGFGHGVLVCRDCDGTVGGLTGGVSAGIMLDPRLSLGLGATIWTKSQDAITKTVGTVDARLRVYPATTHGVFLTAGLGVGSIGADVSGIGTASKKGVGLVFGMGVDFRAGSHLNLTPFWNGFAIQGSDADAIVSQMGIGLTFH